MSERLVVVGDTLLDRDVHGRVHRVAPDAPVPVLDEERTAERPGGAGLAALLVARSGTPVTLVTALGEGEAGERAAALLAAEGVAVVDIGLRGPTPQKVRLFADGHPVARLDRGGEAPAAIGAPTPQARAAIGWADAVLVSDYGRGMSALPWVREALAALADRIPVVWDPHPRGGPPVPGVLLATPNEGELAALGPPVPGAAPGPNGAVRRAAAAQRAWRARHVCVTRSRAGALLVGEDGDPVLLPAAPVEHGDPCGAGDRFAGAAACALACGAPVADAAASAVTAASAFVAAGGARAIGGRQGAPRASGTGASPLDRALALADGVRAAGGAVVATGGCFDLLHAGHLRLLEAAARLGDHLIVMLNDDASVARLKGPERPIVRAHDRAALLAALGCVSAVVPFSEDTPERVLRALRPDVWVKGGDYRAADLPEADAVRSWGGEVVTVPLVPESSTTRLIERARAARA